MKITVDIKRVFLTFFACVLTAVLPLLISTGEMFYTFSIPLFFSIAVPLTSFDKITTKKKYHAFLLSVMLTTIFYFFSVPLGVFLGQSFPGEYAIYVLCVISGLMILLINSIFIQIDNLKLGLLVTGVLALLIPALTKSLKGYKVFNIEFLGDPATFFIIWQATIGLALAVSIWTKTKAKTENY